MERNCNFKPWVTIKSNFIFSETKQSRGRRREDELGMIQCFAGYVIHYITPGCIDFRERMVKNKD